MSKIRFWSPSDSRCYRLICSFAYLAKEAYGFDSEAVALGTPNEETAVLDYFGVEAPSSAKAEGAEQGILTDHNNSTIC